MENNKLKLMVAANPVLVLFLGACPAMALTADVRSALAIAVILFALLIISSIVSALIGRFLARGVKIVVYVLLNAALAISAQMLLHMMNAEVHGMVGIYAALLAVDLCILDVQEASEAGIVPALANAVVTGLYLAVVLFLVAAVREVFGSASFMGAKIDALANYKIVILAKAPGGFGVLAVFAAIISKIKGTASVPTSVATMAAGLTKEV